MLDDLLQRKKELERKILNLTKDGRLSEISEISHELKKVENEIFSLLENKKIDDLETDDSNFLDSIPKTINQTADNINDEFDEAFSNICSDCNYEFPIDADDTAPICTNCGSTRQASKQRVFNTGLGILASLAAALIGWVGLFLGPFAIIAWVISFFLGLLAINFFFSFIGFFVMPIYYKVSWFLACLVTKRGTTSNHFITRYMLLVVLIGLGLISLLLDFLSEHTHIFS